MKINKRGVSESQNTSSSLLQAQQGNNNNIIKSSSRNLDYDNYSDDVNESTAPAKANGIGKGQDQGHASTKCDKSILLQNLASIVSSYTLRLLEPNSKKNACFHHERKKTLDNTGSSSSQFGAPSSLYYGNCSDGENSWVSTFAGGDEGSLTNSLGGELDSVTLLQHIGANPTEGELARVAWKRAQESITGCFSVAGSGILDRSKFDQIPCYTKSELLIGQHLGKGSFSDVFEVMVPDNFGIISAEVPDELDAMHSITANKMKSPYVLKNSSSPSVSNHLSIDQKRMMTRRHSMSSSLCIGSSGRPHLKTVCQGTQLSLAMKCLRPQARSNMEHFLVGVEDLVHETAILSSLDHPNIIKLHGRAGDDASFKLHDGYFILLDRLQETLQDKIDRWTKKFPNSSKSAPSIYQIKDACALSDALSYLHASDIIFRDLKPVNVGFDARGTLKLFDFGFSVSVSRSPKTSSAESEDHNHESSQDMHLLHERCGTLRYMAPEVAMYLGYGKEVDVYSFGILLWEMCALKKPFRSIKSADEFINKVFLKGDRPKVGKYWPDYLKATLQSCWSSVRTERPSINYVKSMLVAAVHELESQASQDSGSSSLEKSFTMTKRLTWNL